MITFVALALISLLPFTIAEFGLAAQLFQLSNGSSVTNVKLAWDNTIDVGANFSLFRSVANGTFEKLAVISGNSFDDYDQKSVDESYNYRVDAVVGNTTVDQSEIATVRPFTPSAAYDVYDNTQVSPLNVKSNIYANGTYYQYSYEQYSNGSMSGIVEQTSTDGYNFSGSTVVLTGQDVCASINYSCILQRTAFNLHPGTGQVVMWAHLENTENYDLAQVAVAYGAPGQPWTFGGTYRPLGYDSRDMAFFADDDGSSAYLISAVDTNTNMIIFDLTANWTAVASVAAEVYMNQYREAPAMMKKDGVYFLYTSRANGWLPSLPEYITAQTVSGPWTNASVLGNTATFCTQSGSVFNLSDGQFAMTANRWSEEWSPPAGPDRDILLPLAVSPKTGFVGTHFYPSVKYSDNITEYPRGLFGVQTGKIVSTGKPSESNAGSENITLANDGIQTDPNAYFIPSTTPFWYQIDLESAYQITQVDLTTYLLTGSDTYYSFNVTGSVDGSSFELLMDQSNNTDVGFVASYSNAAETYRYVRLNVGAITDRETGNSATWAAGIIEAVVYGL